MIAIDLRSLMETRGKISGVENYLLNVLTAFNNEDAPRRAASDGSLFGFYNSFRDVSMPETHLQALHTRIPNKIFNAALVFLNVPKFENLYKPFNVLWMPDLRPFAIRPQTKLALTVHDLSPIMHPEFYSLKRRLWHRFIRYGKAAKRANIIFADSEYTKFDLIKFFGIDQNKIKVVYPGIDQRRFNNNLDQRIKHKVKEKYQLPEKFILGLSTLEPRKNFESLLAAFEKISDPEAHLVIAGRAGWLYNNLIDQIKNSSKNAKIKLLGYVEEQDKPYLYALSNLLCYPSYYEGFGFVPLEAMACGTPVITSARTSMPEVVGDAALLVEPYRVDHLVAAINEMLADQKLREHFIAKGLERVKNFSWQQSANQIYEHLCELA